MNLFTEYPQMIFYFGIALSFVGIALMESEKSLFGIAGMVALIVGISLIIRGRRKIDEKSRISNNKI